MFEKKEDAKFCPLIKKTCKGSDCMFATKLRGIDPNSGAEVDDEGCAVAWLPMLLIENNKAQHETGAAVESFRNESVKNHNQMMAVSLAANGVINGSPDNRLTKNL